MNNESLREIIKRYEENIDFLNNEEHDEKFKWRAVQHFQEVWFAPGADEMPFAELFREATKESAVLINNATVQPANGVVKLAEIAPDGVEHLVRDILFADDDGDLALRQDHIEEFLDGMEKLLHQHYPGRWKYHQDRHSASSYLAMYAPEDNYIYKYSPVEAFAQSVEFGKDIGNGASFNLTHYYELGDIVVSALREHPDLLSKHEKLLDGTHYKDDSLHLLAFDIIYCSYTYGYLKGIDHMSKKDAIKEFALEQKRQAAEEERQTAISAIDEQIHALELELDEYRAISLVGTQVFTKNQGTGVVFEQDANVVHVKFGDEVKKFIISNRYSMRPTFEDDAEIVEAMTQYEAKLKEIELLNKKKSAMKVTVSK